MTDNELIQEALKRWGVEKQLDMVIEECAELIHAIQKWKRGRVLSALVVEEGVDVELCLEQLKAIIHDPDRWGIYRKEKMDRLARKLGVTRDR